MLHAKFQVSSRPGTCFSKIQNWPLTVFYMYIGPASVFFSLLGFEFGVMWGCFSDVFGLPYRLASLLMKDYPVFMELLLHIKGALRPQSVVRMVSFIFFYS